MQPSTSPIRIARFATLPVLGAVALAGALLFAALPVRAEVEPVDCGSIDIGVDGQRAFEDCYHGSDRVHSTEGGGRLFKVTVTIGQGADMRARAIMRVVRVVAGQYVVMQDTSVEEFAGYYLLDGSRDWRDAGTHGRFELMTVEAKFEDLDHPLPCYVFLRQWGYGVGSGFKNQLGGFLCPVVGGLERGTIEDFLDTLHY